MVDIEIILRSEMVCYKEGIVPVVQKYLEKLQPKPNTILKNFDQDEDIVLYNDVQSIIIGDLKDKEQTSIDFNSHNLQWYVYSLDSYGPLNLTSEDDEDQIYGYHYILPSAELCDIWENLYYDNDIKENLLKYAQTMMKYSDNGINENIISFNKVVFLHGPPGTGKTSLCKALAQKISIRMQNRFQSGVFIEVKTDGLFSKYFSESVKSVNKMFTKIHDIIDNKSLIVCVLIDEVETLTHARELCTDTDPSDSIKVVNAVLTQIDQLKRFPNVLVFATSNMTDTVDIAFVDRADIKQYLGLPTSKAIYKIYHSCLCELIKTKIIQNDAELLDTTEFFLIDLEKLSGINLKLWEICKMSEGLSGRSLRKVPFIADALFTKRSFSPLSEFLSAMKKAIEMEHASRQSFKKLKPNKD
ncbi:pachytene checkpoint protein 2 homolog [Aethina tumida]|uniref:pachytene checkpoint protein 2 homolog n=1 Tax=Aethina tumida TaxID=116153 RepID=UPI002148FD29|nr:pachytene checkpoint protein 2 homolog [Aethina tumida]